LVLVLVPVQFQQQVLVPEPALVRAPVRLLVRLPMVLYGVVFFEVPSF
jgi:hypothetical protein